MSDLGSRTASPASAVGQNSPSASAEPGFGGTRSTGRPALRRAAAVAGPTAATLVSAGRAGRSPRVAARSTTAETALTEVNPTQAKSPAARATRAKSNGPGSDGGATAISGTE